MKEQADKPHPVSAGKTGSSLMDYSMETAMLRQLYQNSLITAAYPRPPNKRSYGCFPKPHRTNDGRVGANITLIQSGKRLISVRGQTLEEYETKAFERLANVYLGNRKCMEQNRAASHDFYEKSADSVCRFCKAAKTKEIRQNTEWFIKHFGLDKKDLPSGINSSRVVTDKPTQLLESNV